MSRNILSFHPSRGPAGSTYQTRDGETYVRTPWGMRKMEFDIGISVHSLQQAFVLATSRRRLVHAASAALGLLVGVVLTLWLA